MNTPMLNIDDALLDQLLQKAAESPRLRVIHDLRNTPDDLSQCALNALMPGTQVPIHRHPLTAETVVILRGSLTEVIYDEDGRVASRQELQAGSMPVALQVPKGSFHTVEVHTPAVILEFKDGPWQPLSASDLL